MDGQEVLKQGLEEAGLKLSVAKAGFLLSSNEGKKALNLFRIDAQPRVRRQALDSQSSHGLAPQRMRILRLQLARHGGLQTGGNVDIVLDQHDHLQGPLDTTMDASSKPCIRAWPNAQRWPGGFPGRGRNRQITSGWPYPNPWHHSRRASWTWNGVQQLWMTGCVNPKGILPANQLNLEFSLATSPAAVAP